MAAPALGLSIGVAICDAGHPEDLQSLMGRAAAALRAAQSESRLGFAEHGEAAAEAPSSGAGGGQLEPEAEAS